MSSSRRALLLIEHPLSVAGQQLAEFFLLLLVHLQIAQSQHLLVRQEFHSKIVPQPA